MPTISFTTDASQAARLATAMGARLSLKRDATAAEIKAEVINFLRSVVSSYEKEQAAKSASPVFEPT